MTWRSRCSAASALVCVVLATGVCVAGAQTPRYTLVDLGATAQGFIPRAIGEDGTVVGQTGSGGRAPSIWRDGAFVPLPQGTLQACDALDINATGLIAGLCYPIGPGNSRAVTWTAPPGGPITGPNELPSFLDGPGSYGGAVARGVSTDGRVVGEAFEKNDDAPSGSGAPPFRRAVYWGTDGALRRLDGTTFTGADDAVAFGVNARGTVAGYTAGTAGGRRWSVGDATTTRVDGDPSPLGAVSVCSPHPINDADQTIGRRKASATGLIRWSDGTIVDTGTFLPVAINQAGATVGAQGGRAAMRGVDGVVVDLNTLLPDPSAMTLTAACDLNERGEIIGFGTVGGTPHVYVLTLAKPTLSVTLDAPVASSGDLVSVRLTATNSGSEPLSDVVFPSGMGVARDASTGGLLAGMQSVFAPSPGFGPTIPANGSVEHTLVFEVTSPGSARLVTRVKAMSAAGSPERADAALRIDAELRPASQWETRQAVAGAFTQLAAKLQDARAKGVKRLVDAVRRDLSKNPKTRKLLKATRFERALAQQHGLPANALSWMPNVVRRDREQREGIVPAKPDAAELSVIFAAESSERMLRRLDKSLDKVADNVLITPGLFWRDYLRGIYNGQEGAINAELADAAAETYTKGKGLLSETARFYASEDERRYLADELPRIYDELAAKVDAYRDKSEFDAIKWDDLLRRDPRKAVKVFAGKLGDLEGAVAGFGLEDAFDPAGNAAKALSILRKGSKAADLSDVVDAVTPPGQITERLAERGAARIVKSGTAPARTPIKGLGNLNEDQLDFLSDTVDRLNRKFGVDIEIQARPVNAYSANIADGIGKVEAVPTKNLTPDDVIMGAPEDWLGQTAYYKPELPKGFSKLKDADKRRIQLRYDEKLDEYKKFKGLKDDPTGKADKVKKMLKKGGADVALGDNYKARIELAAIERDGATLIQYKKLEVNGNAVFKGKPRPIVSDIDFNAVVDRVSQRNLPAGIRGQVELELMNEFSKAQRSGLIPFGFHGWTHSGFDAKSKDFRYIAKYMLMYATEEQALRYARRWAPKFFPELGRIADPRKYERAYRQAVEKILEGYTQGKHLVKITADGALIGPGVDPTVGLPLP